MCSHALSAVFQAPTPRDLSTVTSCKQVSDFDISMLPLTTVTTNAIINQRDPLSRCITGNTEAVTLKLNNSVSIAGCTQCEGSTTRFQHRHHQHHHRQ